MADAISIQELIDARTDAKTLEEAVNGDAVTTVLSRLGETYPTLSNALNQIDSKLDSADTQIKQGITNLFENGGLPATPFATKALMTASALVDGDYAMVTDDTANNGLYVKTAGAWVKSSYDPLTQANSYTDTVKTTTLSLAATDAQTKASAAQTAAITTASSNAIENDKASLQKNNNKEFVGTTSEVIPLATDYSGLNVLLGYDKTKDTVIGSGLVNDYNIESKLNKTQGIQGFRGLSNDEASIIPIVSDLTARNIILGFDVAKSEVVGNFQKVSYNKENLANNINMVLFAGQSLSMGTSSTPVLSSTSKFATVQMFNNGSRALSGSTSFVPLVETADPDNYVYETPLSGFANYAMTRAYRDYSIEPSSHPMLMSCAGWGASPIAWHIKGGMAYEQRLIPQVVNAVKINPNIAVRAVCFMHGETSATNSITDADYYNAVKSIVKDFNADIAHYTKQDKAVRFIGYQIAYKIKLWREVAVAQLRLVKDDVVDLASPTYRFEHCTADTVHLSGEASKLAGAYFSRAYLQRTFECRKPDWLEPLSAIIKSDTIRVKFKAPKLPLRFETTDLPAVTNNGFVVHVNDVEVPISTIDIDSDTVVIKLSNVPNGVVKVRYALDYNSTTYNNYQSGAVGNLTDSTTDTVNIASKDFTMFHCAPHFELTTKTLEI